MSAGAFKNIFLSLNSTTKHTRQRLFALVIHVVMCSVTGAMAKGVSVGKCVAPLATFYCGRNIAHNEQSYMLNRPIQMNELLKCTLVLFSFCEGSAINKPNQYGRQI